MKQIVVFLMIVAALVAIQPVQAEPYNDDKCAPDFPVIAGPAPVSIAAGTISWCVKFPNNVQPGSTIEISSTLHAPATVAPVFTTAANAFGAVSGCTEGTPTATVPTANGIVGTTWSVTSFLTMTAEQCVFVAGATLTVGVAPQQYYNEFMAFAIQTENYRVDNFDYLCDAPGIAPNAYSTTGTVCNDVVLSATVNAILNGNMTLNGNLTVHDDNDGWIIHQDPISGELSICPETSPCFVEGMNTTVNVGDTTVNVSPTINVNGTFNGTINGTLGNATKEPGWDGSLYILLLIIVAVLAHLGEIRRDNIYRVFAGFILLLDAFVLIWELERIGFNHLFHGYGLGFATGFIILQGFIALYLMVPKDWEKTEEEEN